MRLLSVSEVAEMLGAGKATVYEWTKLGTIPGGFKLNGLLRFDEAEIIRWIEIKKKVARNLHN